MNELVRWDPFKTVAPFEDSFFAIPSLFRPLTARAVGGPRMDVAENDTSYMLAIELAGVKKDAIQVSVYDNFSRSISLPEPVDDTASEARFIDGVLYLTLKKKSASQTRRLAIH